MVLQLENCTDILKALHTRIDLIFLFDNPCGNDRGREVRFNITKINSGYGGAQQDMYPTDINQEGGYLGPHEQII